MRESVNDGWRVRILRSLPPLCVFSNGGTSGLLPLPSLSPSQSLVVKAGGLVAAGLGKVFLGKWEKALKIICFVFITPSLTPLLPNVARFQLLPSSTSLPIPQLKGKSSV